MTDDDAAPALPPRRPSAPPQTAAQDAAVEKMFARLLELQLIPAEAQKKLLQLPLDKKQQMIAMHASLLADADAKVRFSEDDANLLDKLRAADAALTAGDSAAGAGALQASAGARNPAELLDQLHTRLATANREWLRGFLDKGGLKLAAGVARRRLCRDPLGAADARTVASALKCFKAVCNNAEGLGRFADTPHALDALAGCLEPGTVLADARGPALDVLCVAVWASDAARCAVLASLDRLARHRLEMPFAWAAAFLETCRDDVQAQAKVLALCNQLVMRAPSLEDRCATRNAMVAAGVLDAAAEASEGAENRAGGVEEEELPLTESEMTKPGVDPRRGQMRGDLVLVEPKRPRRGSSFFSKSKKAKPEPYALARGVLTGKELELRLDEVLAVRPAAQAAAHDFSFELVFAPPRHPLAFGARRGVSSAVPDGAEDHDQWVAALKVARRDAGAAPLARSASAALPQRLREDAAQLRKQLEVFRAVAAADAERTRQPQLEDADCADVGQLAGLVARAGALAGAPDVAVRLLQELLLWPVEAALGAAAAWQLALRALRFTREKRDAIDGGDDAEYGWSQHALALGELVESNRKTERAARFATGAPVAQPPPVIAVALGDEPAAAPKASPEVAKFQKMLKMHVPRVAIELKMRAEGLDPGLLDSAAPSNAAAAVVRCIFMDACRGGVTGPPAAAAAAASKERGPAAGVREVQEDAQDANLAESGTD